MDDATRIEFETRLLFQEDTLAKLSDVLADQQRQIDRLSEKLDRMVALLERRDSDAQVEIDYREEHLTDARGEHLPRG